MIIVFKRHSPDASSRKAINSLIASGKDVEATVLRGDPRLTIALIESLDFKHTYTSGLCSFENGAEVLPEIEEDVMDRFELAAFAGLGWDQYCILWVRRINRGRHELHFIVPRVELSTCKAFNPAPPGNRDYFDALCDFINFKYGFADPRGKARRRELGLPKLEERRRAEERRNEVTFTASPRTALHERLVEYTKKHTSSVITREDMISHLCELGLEVPRVGDRSITVKIPGTETKWRLTGTMYEKGWDSSKLCRGDGGETEKSGPQPERAKEAWAALEEMRKKAAAYNLERYGSGHDSEEVEDPTFNSTYPENPLQETIKDDAEDGALMETSEETLGRIERSIAKLDLALEEYERWRDGSGGSCLDGNDDPDKSA